MKKSQEKHLQRIKDQFIQLADQKYRAGQKEHGGDLWTMGLKQLINNLKDEIVDAFTYLQTLEDNLNELEDIINRVKKDEGRVVEDSDTKFWG